MKFDQEHIANIKVAFEQMQTREDLLHILNVVKPLLYGKKAVPFKLQQLTWYANPKLGGKRYTEFKIQKKSGSQRSIHAPIKGLKALQKTLAFVLQCVYEPHMAATGFVHGKSIVDNAKLHVGSKYVYNIDLKDFFPSIDQARVWKCLQLKPFNLNSSNESDDLLSINDQVVKISLQRFYSFKAESTSERRLLVEYKGLKLITGWHTLKLRSGEKIIYKIEQNIDSDSGSMFIYTDRSSFELLKEYISTNQPDKAGDEAHLYVSLINLCFSHQKKKRTKNNRTKLANLIASICCTQMEVERITVNGEWEKVKRNVLPQGAPTSPILTNIVCQKLDFLLTGMAKRFGLKYSRYADDITFSSMHNVYRPESEFLKELKRIILEQNFHIKESKTRLQKDGYRKEVTGLLVNDKVNVQKRYIKQLRMWLYYWERYGYKRASEFFLQQYIADKGHVKSGKPDMGNVISGKLDYLKMVKGDNNELYVKLRGRFEALIGSNETKVNRHQYLDNVINLLFEKGLDVAMDNYKP